MWCDSVHGEQVVADLVGRGGHIQLRIPRVDLGSFDEGRLLFRDSLLSGLLQLLNKPAFRGYFVLVTPNQVGLGTLVIRFALS